MNRIKYFLLLFALTLIVSCETYEEPAIEYAPTYPLSGEYITWIYENGTLYDYGYTLRLYNTSSNSSDSIWVKISSKALPFGSLTKVGCNVSNLTFGTNNGNNLAFTPSLSCTITEGKLYLKGASMKPSGAVPDSIRFVVTQGGSTFEIAGFRRTQWLQDEL